MKSNLEIRYKDNKVDQILKYSNTYHLPNETSDYIAKTKSKLVLDDLRHRNLGELMESDERNGRYNGRRASLR